MEESTVVERKAASAVLLAAGLVFGISSVSMGFYEESLTAASDEVRPVEIVEGAGPGQPAAQVSEKNLPQASETTPVPLELRPYQSSPSKDDAPQPAATAPKPVQEKARVAQTKPKKPGVTREIGKKDKMRVIKVTAKGAKLPLSAAMSIVMPKGWNADLGAAGKKKVSFSAKQLPWTSVVDSLARKADVSVVIDWNKAVVRVDKGTVVPTAAAHPVSPARVQGGIVKKAVLDRPGRGDEVARRYGLPVADFCRWNNFGPATPLPAGYEVYLQEPPAGTQVVANMPTWSVGTPEPPVKPTPVTATSEPASVAATPVPTQPLPVTTPAVTNTQQPVQEVSTPQYAVMDYQYALGPGPLSGQLSQWCAHGGYQLVWKVDEEFEIMTHSAYGTDFHKALETLFNDLKSSGFPLRGTVFERNHMVEVAGE